MENREQSERVYAFDIGGSAIKHGLVRVEGSQAQIIKRGTTIPLVSRRFNELYGAVVEILSTVTRDEQISKVGICTTGTVDESGIVLKAGNFVDYQNINWQKLLGKAIGSSLQVSVINDGRASAWAEFCGQNDYDSLLHVVVGTGIGTGVVLGNKLFLGQHGHAGVLSCIKVNAPKDIQCSGCGSVGCVQTVSTGPAIARGYARFSNSSANVGFTGVVAQAKAGNSNAISAIEAAGSWLGLAISYAINVLDPGLITIGGGVIDALNGNPLSTNLYVDTVKSAIEAHSFYRIASVTKVQAAQYGNDGGMLGAALYASQA